MSSYVRGDVVLVDFPNADLVTFKRRPALVVQDTTVMTGLPQVVVVLITSNLNRTGVTRVRVNRTSSDGAAMGLLMDSVIVTDNMATVAFSSIAKKVGLCPIMDRVGGALKATLML